MYTRRCNKAVSRSQRKDFLWHYGGLIGCVSSMSEHECNLMVQDQGELPSGWGLVIERVKYMRRIVPMLDKVAKKTKILLGSRIHEREVRLEPLLRTMHLPPAMVHLPSLTTPEMVVVIVFWWFARVSLECSAVIPPASMFGLFAVLIMIASSAFSASVLWSWALALALALVFFSAPHLKLFLVAPVMIQELLALSFMAMFDKLSMLTTKFSEVFWIPILRTKS